MQRTTNEQRQDEDNGQSKSEARENPTNETLAVKAKAGDRDALAALWEQNRGILALMLRRLIANPNSSERMKAQGITLEDLEQESYFAVINAVEGYDPTSGAKFTTFLRYPVMTMFFKAVGFRTSQQRGEPLSRASSLDEPLDTEDAEGSTRGDLIPDKQAAAAFQHAEKCIYIEQLHQDLERCLDDIEPQQAAVLRARYYDGKTLRAIAEPLNVTIGYVQQIEVKALRAMRRKGVRILKPHHADVISKAYCRTGFTAWKNGGSVEENFVEWMERNKLS